MENIISEHFQVLAFYNMVLSRLAVFLDRLPLLVEA